HTRVEDRTARAFLSRYAGNCACGSLSDRQHRAEHGNCDRHDLTKTNHFLVTSPVSMVKLAHLVRTMRNHREDMPAWLAGFIIVGTARGAAPLPANAKGRNRPPRACTLETCARSPGQ